MDSSLKVTIACELTQPTGSWPELLARHSPERIIAVLASGTEAVEAKVYMNHASLLELVIALDDVSLLKLGCNLESDGDDMLSDWVETVYLLCGAEIRSRFVGLPNYEVRERFLPLCQATCRWALQQLVVFRTLALANTGIQSVARNVDSCLARDGEGEDDRLKTELLLWRTLSDVLL